MKSLNWAFALPLGVFGLSAGLLGIKLLGWPYLPRWVWLAPVGLYAAFFVGVAVHVGWEQHRIEVNERVKKKFLRGNPAVMGDSGVPRQERLDERDTKPFNPENMGGIF